MAKVRLTAPWDEYYKKLVVLFKYDDEVNVVYFEEDNKIKIFVDNPEKAEALQKVIPEEKEWGNVNLTLEVIPSNKKKRNNSLSVPRSFWGIVFEGNPVLSFIHTVDGIFTNPITYVVFVNEVVQYFNDDLSDINGNRSTLYQEIAKEVFLPVEGTCFCTDTPEGLDGLRFERP